MALFTLHDVFHALLYILICHTLGPSKLLLNSIHFLLIVLQRSGATDGSLSCTEYENLGGFLPLLMRSRGPISTSTHFFLLVGTQVQPEGRSGRPRAPCTCAQQRILPVLQVSVEPLYAVALQVVPTVTCM